MVIFGGPRAADFQRCTNPDCYIGNARHAHPVIYKPGDAAKAIKEFGEAYVEATRDRGQPCR